MLKNGQIDAAFTVAGAPTTAITELATSGMDFSLVSLDQEHVDALHEKYPFLVQENLPAGTYEGVTLRPSVWPSRPPWSLPPT